MMPGVWCVRVTGEQLAGEKILHRAIWIVLAGNQRKDALFAQAQIQGASHAAANQHVDVR